MKTDKLSQIAPLLLAAVLISALTSGVEADVTITVQPKNATVSLGANAVFTGIGISTTSPISYQWWFKGAALDVGANPSAATTRLSLTNVTLASAGPYYVVASDPSGGSATSQVATLIVDPTFTKITTGPVVTDIESSEAPTWWDYDNDGFLDLFVGNGVVPPGLVTDSVYHNNGDGTFSKVTNAISTHRGLSFDGAVGDYNNDGLDDLFVAEASGADDLYRNDGGGHFTRLTQAEVGPLVGDMDYSVEAGWADYDRDGFIDVFVANGYYLAQGGQFTVGNDKLYRNNGDGTFTAMTTNQVGMLVGDHALTGPCAWADYDNDGWPDLWVGSGYGPTNGKQYLYHNNGDGTFSQVQGGSLAEKIATGMGYWADYDNDGYLELFLPASPGTNSLHRYLGGQTFTNVAKSAGVAKPMGAWPAAWGDYDNDGYLDLFVAGYDGGTRSVLYHNNGDGTFTSVDVGSPLQEGAKRSGVAWSDYDNDGFLDLLITCGDGEPNRNLLYHNNGNGNHWFKLKLIGTASNRSAIGAKVRVDATIGGKTFWQMREISGNSGASGGASGLVAHFGLGDATNVTTVRIEWPSGNVQELTDVPSNQMLTVKEAVNITPTNPSSSLNGSVTLTSTRAGTYQWRFEGADLAGETNKALNLAGIQMGQAGRYSLVVTTSDQTVTNHVYLHVDPTFTKITTGDLVSDKDPLATCAWGDYDNDGYPDVVVAGGYYTGGHTHLYHNNQDGTFTKVTTGPIATSTDKANYCTWADVDNDGNLDLWIGSNESQWPALYLNHGQGVFTLIRPTADWIANQLPVHGSTQAFGDYDRDGYVDLAVGAWVDGNIPNRLLHNTGEGRFSVVTNSTFVLKGAAPETISWVDYDNNGTLDLFVSQSGSSVRQNYLFRTLADGTLEPVTTGPVVGDRSSGYWIGGFWGDYDNDGNLDLLVTDATSRSQLYHNNGDGTFDRVSNVLRMSAQHAAWGDYDNDGNLDIILAGAPNRLFRGDGKGQFVEVLTGSLLASGLVPAWVDYDRNGFLDLFVATDGQAKLLYRNNGNSNRWLEVKLAGTASNRSAIGAKVRAKATISGQTVWQVRQISAQATTQELLAHFGLGDATNVTTLRIEWPSGAVQELSNVTPNQFLTIWEPPALKAAVQTDRTCLLTVTAEPNRNWRVESSTDLNSWEKLATVNNASPVFQYDDTKVAGMVCRFYRVVAE